MKTILNQVYITSVKSHRYKQTVKQKNYRKIYKTLIREKENIYVSCSHRLRKSRLRKFYSHIKYACKNSSTCCTYNMDRKLIKIFTLTIIEKIKGSYIKSKNIIYLAEIYTTNTIC